MTEAALKEDFSYWKAQLAGQNPELTDKLPRCGCYRYRGDPVLIRVVDGTMFAWIGRKGQQTRRLADASFAETTFSFFCRDAISSDLYDAVANKNQPWPEDIESLDDARSNFPTDPFEALIAELDLIELKIAEFFKTPVLAGDDVRALQADKWKERARELSGKIEDMRVAAKKPIDQQAKEIQKKFVPPRDRADALVTKVNTGMSVYSLAKKRAVEAQEAADRAARAKAAAAMGEAAPVEQAPVRGRSKVATGSTTVRTRKVAVINDLPAAAAFYAALAEPPVQFVTVVKQMAEQNLKTGVAVPGCELKTLEYVA